MKNRSNLILLLFLLLSVIACAVIWAEDPTPVLYLSCVPFFFLQLLLLRLSERRTVHLLPVISVLVTAIAGALLGLFGKSLTPLLGLILLCGSIAPAVGTLLAWLLVRFVSRRSVNRTEN